MNTAVDTPPTDPAATQLKLADWLWRPWYAKAWWAAILAWWIGMAVSTKVAPLKVRWSRLLGQVGGEVKLIPDVIMPPVWSSDHGGHAPHDLKHRSVHRPLPGFAPLDPSAVAACCSR